MRISSKKYVIIIKIYNAWKFLPYFNEICYYLVKYLKNNKGYLLAYSYQGIDKKLQKKLYIRINIFNIINNF